MSELAEILHTGTPLTVRVGVIVDVTDSTHALVDVGERVIGAAWPRSLGTPVAGVACTLLVGDGVARVISSDQAPPTPPAAVKIAGGSGTMTFSASSTASDAESFPAGLFSAAPIVVASLRTSGLGIAVSVTNVTASGCTVRGITAGGTNISETVAFDWIAYQP